VRFVFSPVQLAPNHLQRLSDAAYDECVTDTTDHPGGTQPPRALSCSGVRVLGLRSALLTAANRLVDQGDFTLTPFHTHADRAPFQQMYLWRFSRSHLLARREIQRRAVDTWVKF